MFKTLSSQERIVRDSLMVNVKFSFTFFDNLKLWEEINIFGVQARLQPENCQMTVKNLPMAILLKKKSSFWPFFDIQLAIFRRVRLQQNSQHMVPSFLLNRLLTLEKLIWNYNLYHDHQHLGQHYSCSYAQCYCKWVSAA